MQPPLRSAWLAFLICPLLGLAIPTLFLPGRAAEAPPVGWPLFAMQTATRDAAHESAEAQVQLVKELGYEGIGAVGPAELTAFAAACDDRGVRLWNTYFTVELDAAPALSATLKTQLAPLKGRNAMLWVGLTSKQHPPSSLAGDAEAVKVVTELADVAQSLGARVALYPHASFWIERTDDAVRIAQRVNRPEVGVTFNLCHFLKVDDESRLETVLQAARPHLFMVSLNGAESGRRGAEWKELIQTLDRGSFDNTRLLRALRDLGYSGPVGFQGYGIGGDAADNLRRTRLAWLALNGRLAGNADRATADHLRFRADGKGGFVFDTGALRGRLHADGKSLGLTEVVHVPTGARLDRSNGLLSHYRVFTRGVRHGGGAWDWPSDASLGDDGSVTVRFAAERRPFELTAVYRWSAAAGLDVETRVEAKADLTGFESFLASYFDPAFTNAAVRVKTPMGDQWVEATPARGDWQMYVRDAAARQLVEDGRWTLEPHPVAWTFPFEVSGPTAEIRRVAVGSGLAAGFSARAEDCFALAMPHQTEGHYSVYLSLFGRDFKAGESAIARVRLVVDQSPLGR